MRPLSLTLLAGAATAIASSASVCPEDNSHATGDALQAILDYKNSDHEIMAAYFRSWRDVASDPKVNKVSFEDLPDCLDIAFVFSEGDEPAAFYTALKDKYVPTLHSRGTKLVRTVGIQQLLNKNYTNDEEGYESLAKHLLETLVDAHGLDGLDVDVEASLNADQLKQAAGVFKALSKSLGPKSNTGKILIYDTNQNGDTALFKQVHSYVSYALVQSYGRSLSGLQRTFDTYKPYISANQYLFGFSFYEERGAHWGDTNAPINTSRAYSYAKWEPKGTKKGGIFSYATDRDGVPDGQDAIVPTDFSWTRELISVMNP